MISFCSSVSLKQIHLLVVIILASHDAVKLIRADNRRVDVPLQLLSIPNNGSNGEVLIANAMDTHTPILRSDDGSYAWQFAPYQNNKTRLLVILNMAYNATIIWIANRNHPVSPNASLSVELPSCIFRLRDVDGSIAWSPPVDDIRTVFMNSTGNLIMYNAHNASIWQSFDNAWDLLVPGQMIRTNHSLVSSLSPDDVSEGHYTLYVQPGGIVLYASFDWQQHMVPYAADTYAGSLDVFSSVQVRNSLLSACNHTNLIYEMGGTGIALQQEGSIITPQCRAEVGNIADDAHALEFGARVGGTGLRFIRLMPNGDVNTFLSTNSSNVLDKQLFGDMLGTFCRLPSYCGINSLCSSRDNCTCPQMFTPIIRSGASRLGCQLIEPFDCRISSQHQFLAVPGLDYFANTYQLNAPTVSSADECQSMCRANCSCTAAFYRNDSQKCHLYDQVQTMLPVSDQSITAYLRVAKLPITEGSSSISKKVIIGVTTGLAMMVVMLVLFVGWIGRRIMKKRSGEESDSEEEAFLESLPGLPPRFTYKELHSATEGFSKKLGTGGSGTVYEGHILPAELQRNNKQLTTNTAMQQDLLLKVAVKQLELSRFPTMAASGKKQFRAEVATLGSLNHVNLVQLRGFCAEGTNRLLIYEFLENGSLDRWIFNSATPLQWEVRYRIAADTARGLAFLHEASRDKVVHLDVKPQNILLDSNFGAKLADFGLCKLVGREAERGDQRGGVAESQTVTAMRGTPGYMAPEWFLNLPVTDRSDVFSFGMVLLELVGGRKNLNLAAGTTEGWYIPAWAVRQAESGNLLDVIDKELTQHATDQSTSAMCVAMTRLLQVAFWCIQENAGSRPSMGTVLLMLEEHLQVPDPPLDQTYILGRQSRPPLTSTSTSTRASTPASGINSELEPR